VLVADGDFVFIDFEGDPDQLVAERQLKRSPLRDVASMICSFEYAAFTALASRGRPDKRRRSAKRIEQWAVFWAQQVASAFLGEYLRTADGASFVPKDRNELLVLLDTLVLEQLLYEVRNELSKRSEPTHIPLRGLFRVLALSD
jgi:maltose alpha-D-glucosyltransferase / alpha-amylase